MSNRMTNGMMYSFLGYAVRHRGEVERVRGITSEFSEAQWIDCIRSVGVMTADLLEIAEVSRDAGEIAIVDAIHLRIGRDHIEGMMWLVEDGYQEPPHVPSGNVGLPDLGSELDSVRSLIAELDGIGGTIVDQWDAHEYPTEGDCADHLEAIGRLSSRPWWG